MLLESFRTNAKLSDSAKKEIAKTWRTFQFRRFRKFSRGQGSWAPVKKKKRGGILRDSDTLMNSLSPVFRRRRGQFQKLNKTSIRIGIGGNARHPKAKNLTVAQLAAIHHPTRPVIGTLDRRTKNKIKRIMKDDLRKQLRKSRRRR